MAVDPSPLAPVLDSEQLWAIMGAIGAGAGIVAAGIRWAVKRVVKAIDLNSESHREMAKSHITYAESMTALAVKIEGVSDKIDRVSDWMDEHTPTPVEVPTPRAGGYRAPTKPGKG